MFTAQGRLMAGFINQVKSYGIVEALTKYSPEEQYKINMLHSSQSTEAKITDAEVVSYD